MRPPLKELLKRFDDPVLLERELKNANNVAIVMLSMPIPAQGAHSGEKLDVKVSALAAKSLKGGRLFVVPMIAPRADVKMVLASASGPLTVEDDKHPTEATIRQGGVLIEDILPEAIENNTFTLVLHPEMASAELATAIAEQINEDVAPQTGGKPIAVAVDQTSVQVTIPPVERANPTPFIARLKTLPLPTLPDPAKVTIDMKSKLITFSDEVEVAPTMISQGNLTITVGQPATPSRALKSAIRGDRSARAFGQRQASGPAECVQSAEGQCGRPDRDRHRLIEGQSAQGRAGYRMSMPKFPGAWGNSFWGESIPLAGCQCEKRGSRCKSLP